MKRVLALLLFCSVCYGFDERPWIDEPFLFSFRPSVTLSYFPKLANSSDPNFNSFNQDLNLNLGVSTMSNYDIQGEMNFFHSRMRSFNFESIAVQIRKLLLDDVTGDLVSLIAGINYRVVPHHRLKDVAMPYHFVSNFEGVVSIGKEFSKQEYWVFRLYSVLAAGIANKGSPWISGDLAFESLIQNRHQIDAQVNGYFGLGSSDFIQIDTFDGYYDIAHHSVDISAAYRYHFPVYGVLGLEGLYRVYAHAYPKNYFSLTLRYSLPFSLF